MKDCLLLILVMAFASFASANLLINGDFDGSVDDWSYTGNSFTYGGPAWVTPNDYDAACLGWVGGNAMWQDPAGLVFLPNRVYTLTVVGSAPDTGNGQTFEGMQLVIINATDNVDVATLDYLFPAEDASATLGETPGNWRTATLTFDTATDPSLVGKAIRAEVRTIDSDASYGWMYVQSLTLDYFSSPYDPVVTQTDNGAVVDVDLAWKAGKDPAGVDPFNPAIKKHYVYLSYDQNVSTDPNLYLELGDIVDQVSTTDPSASLSVAGLSKDGLYLWKVEEGLDDGQGGVYPAGDPNNIMGSVWTFETIQSIPEITVQPEDVLVELGTLAEMSVDTDIDVTYQWYKSTDDPANNTPGDDTLVPDEVGGKTDTISFASAAIADEGFYYCVATNGDFSDTSDVARLVTRRLIGHWVMEDNLDDSSSTAEWDGTFSPLSVAGAVYDAGFEGQALSLPGEPNDFVTIEGSNHVFNFFDLGLTVNCWVKTTEDSVSGCLVGKRAGGILGDGYYLQVTSSGDVRFYIHGIGQTISSGVPINDGNWHMVTAAYSGIWTGLYIDGEWQAGWRPVTTPRLSDTPVTIGVEEAGGSPFDGLIDDVQIYTYAKTPKEVLLMYNGYDGTTDKYLCLSEYASDFDIANSETGLVVGEDGFEKDCKINLDDFAAFASGWLSCGLYPISACQ